MASQAPATVGGIPTIIPDVPICAVLIAIFLGLAASHMTLYFRNKKRGHWFIFNAFVFGFGMSRVLANILRLVWATMPMNEDVRLVAQVFLNAGILLIYIINLLFSMRLLRAAHPTLGWNPVLRITYKAALYLVLPILIMLITVIVVMAKQPTNAEARTVGNPIVKLGQTYFLVIAASPLLILPLTLYHAPSAPRDPFGAGSWHTKIAMVATTSFLALIEATFRAGTTWAPARPATDPAWWDSRAAFYCFNFMLDVLIMAVFLGFRMDRRMHVPDKCDGPGDYSAKAARREGSASTTLDEEVGVRGEK